MLPRCRLAFGPGVAVSRKAGRLETKQKLPRRRGGCTEHAGGTRLPTAGARPLAAAIGLPTASFPGVFGFRYRNAGGIFSSRELLGASALGWELGAVVPDVLIGDGQVGGSHARGVLRGEDTRVSTPPTHGAPRQAPASHVQPNPCTATCR